ncbi:MAG TPA: YbgC/FadM family acyl-CoA thioesterase [Gammaproteobacteria bacterium]|nr:YbgC/FadM family acyl-CoA thioesterase [Gammaproteobacteria bacterium]
MSEFVLPVRVYLEDTDAQGVVYNASYFRFLERARTEWLRAKGVEHNRLRDEQGLVLVLAGTQVRFRQAATLDDQLYGSAALTEVTGARFVFEQSIRRGAPDGELLCDGIAEVACMDVIQRKPRRVPEALLSELNV